jgi:hypothetical protein
VGAREEEGDGPVRVIPEEELVVDGDPDAVDVWEEAHVGRDIGDWWDERGAGLGGDGRTVVVLEEGRSHFLVMTRCSTRRCMTA